MIGKIDYLRRKFGPLLDKTLKNALAHRIRVHFPRIGGPRIRALCAEMILEIVETHIRPRENLTPGQILWLAYDINDRPAKGKRTADSRMVPVVLDLSLPEDIEARIARVSSAHRMLTKAVRLCRQAFEQGGLLSNCDLAALLNVSDSRIAQLLSEHERQTGQVVPRRATLHDVGSGMTHKRIICHKRYAQGKPPDQIARETYHSLEAVDRYLGQYDRVRHCSREGMKPEQIAYTLDCSLSLVNEYLEIDRELEGEDA